MAVEECDVDVEVVNITYQELMAAQPGPGLLEKIHKVGCRRRAIDNDIVMYSMLMGVHSCVYLSGALLLRYCKNHEHISVCIAGLQQGRIGSHHHLGRSQLCAAAPAAAAVGRETRGTIT